jgi:hypothetical protein
MLVFFGASWEARRNSNVGNGAGRQLADALAASLRPGQIAVSIGTDSLAVVLESVSMPEAVNLATKLAARGVARFVWDVVRCPEEGATAEELAEAGIAKIEGLAAAESAQAAPTIQQVEKGSYGRQARIVAAAAASVIALVLMTVFSGASPPSSLRTADKAAASHTGSPPSSSSHLKFFSARNPGGSSNGVTNAPTSDTALSEFLYLVGRSGAGANSDGSSAQQGQARVLLAQNSSGLSGPGASATGSGSGGNSATAGPAPGSGASSTSTGQSGGKTGGGTSSPSPPHPTTTTTVTTTTTITQPPVVTTTTTPPTTTTTQPAGCANPNPAGNCPRGRN